MNPSVTAQKKKKKFEYDYFLTACEGLGHILGIHSLRRVDESDRELRERSRGLKGCWSSEKLKLGIYFVPPSPPNEAQ